MAGIRGVEELNRKLRALGEIKVNRALLAGALKLQRLSQKNSPVDTGFLRASHSSNETDQGAEMVVSAEYAIYVHEGTRYMRGREWISKAIDEGMSEIVGAVQKATQSLIKDEVD